MESKIMPEAMPESMLANPSGANPSLRLQPTHQHPLYQADTISKFTGNMANQIVYPELFYKLQPFIMMVCDQIDTYSFGSVMLTQEMIEQLSDSVHDDVCHMYPDIAEYADSVDQQAQDDVPVIARRDQGIYGGGLGLFGRRFRRRGGLRDLIDILLISEFFRRRRRIY